MKKDKHKKITPIIYSDEDEPYKYTVIPTIIFPKTTNIIPIVYYLVGHLFKNII